MGHVFAIESLGMLGEMHSEFMKVAKLAIIESMGFTIDETNSQHWHLCKENLEPTLQAFGFGGLYVCTTSSYDDIFSL